MIHFRRSNCRVCGGNNLERFLSLGPSPLANAFPRSEADFAAETRFPLDVYFCSDCSLVQLLDVIDHEVLFKDYIYVTGTSETMAVHNREYARCVVELLNLQPSDLVVDIASNDGSLLKCFAENGMRILGIEPATNIAELAEKKGVETVNQFFNSEVARRIKERFGQATVITANNVLAHVDDPVDFLLGCKELLASNGRIVVEVPYLQELVERLEYDTIYHEHLSYFSATALMNLCDRVGLRIDDLQFFPIHGGSLRMFAAHRNGLYDHAEVALEVGRQENDSGLNKLPRFVTLAQEVAATREKLRELLKSLVDSNHTVAGYGAPAKGNTLLNYCQIDTSLISFIVDKNPLKIGAFTPGMHIPVLPVTELLERQPSYVCILAWNIAEEIIQQQEEYRNRGGRFIIPIPEPCII